MSNVNPYRGLLIGAYEMDILGLIASGMTVDEMLDAGPWSADDISVVVQRHGWTVGDDGRVVTVGLAVDGAVKDALASPSRFVRQQATRAYAQLAKLRQVQAMEAAKDVSADLRRLQLHAVQDWLDWLRAASAGARDELARLRASSPRSDRAKRAAS